MTDVSAGRLHLDAYADTTGFARDARAKIDAAVKDLRAKIKVELDDRGVIKQAKAAAQKAQAAASVKIKTELDTRGLDQKVKTAAAEASKNARVKIGAEIDQAKFQATLAASVKAMSGRYSVVVGVDVDTAAAEARLAAFKAGQKNLPIELGANIRLGNAGQVLGQLSKMPLIAGGVFLLVSAVGQLAGGLFAVVSAASQATVALAAIPNLIGAIAQGGAVLLAGFSGIGDAVTELGEADQASAKQTQTAAGIRVDSARAVADAQQRLRESYHQAADAARTAGFAVQDAEWGLARAQEAAADAQEALNKARVDARENIDELNESLRRAALTEAEASNALQKARQDLQDVMWDPSASQQQIKDAQLAVEAAQVGLDEAKDSHEDVAAAAAQANADGVRGSEQVKDAQDGVRDSNHALMLAERQLAEARHQAADTARQNAQMIADAQQAVVDAQKSGAQSIADQTAAMAEQTSAFDKLTPAAQRFARFLFDTVMPRFDQLRDNIQEAILPPIQEGITRAMPFVDTLEKGLLGTADVVGKLAVRVGTLFGSKGFNKDTALIMDSNNRTLGSFGKVAFNLIKILSDLAVVAGPTLLEPFGKWLVKVTNGWKESVQLSRETGTLTDRFDRARIMANRLKDIIANLGGAIHGMGVAATPAGDSLIGTLEKATGRWDKWANSDAGQKRMKAFFDQTKPTTEEFGRLLGNVSELVIKLGEAGGGPLVATLKTLNAIVTGLNAVLGTPYLGTFVGWLFTLAGVGGALGLVASMFVKLSGGLALLSKVTGITRLWNLFKASTFALRIQLAALYVQEKLVAAGAKIMSGALRAMRAVMGAVRIAATLMFGPWGIAIAAAIGLFILLYKKVDWFREAVQWVMEKVVDAFNWVVDGAKYLWDVLFGHSIFPDIVAGLEWFGDMVAKVFGYVKVGITALAKVFSWLWTSAVKPVFGFMQAAISLVWNYYYKPILKLWWTAIKTFAAIFMWLWRSAIKPAFALMRKGISVLWNNFYKPIFKAFGKGLRALGAVFSWLWREVVKPVWAFIRKAIEAAWNTVYKPIFKAFGKGLSVLGAAFSWLWKRAVKPAWDSIKSGVKTVWDFLRDKVFKPMATFVKTTIPDAFTKAVKGIKGVWETLKDIARKPVEFIVNTVYNKGIRAVVNAIPGVPNLDEVHFAKGGIMPGHTPGRDVHQFYSPTGGQLGLSGGEAFMRPEWTKAVGPKMIGAMNAAAARGGAALRNLMGGSGFADGGVWKKAQNFFLGGVVPLPGATSIKQHLSGYGGYPWAGDLNMPGYEDYGKPIVAWKSGVAHPFDYGRDYSYGRGQIVTGSDGQSSLYAHMSRVITGLAGKFVRAGQTIGYVGDYGNTGDPPTSHLHFEVRNGAVAAGDLGAGVGATVNPAVVKGKQEKKSWMEAIRSILGKIKSFPGMLTKLGNIGGWGSMLTGSVKSMGGSLRGWINDKIPNKIKIPKFPDIPLPDNPIPKLFDRGGAWNGGLGFNGSGQTETVFTNENIVDLTGDLARIATGLRAQTVDSVTGGGGSGSPLVGSLTLQAAPEKVQQVLGDMEHALRLLALGGVHARHIAGAEVA